MTTPPRAAFYIRQSNPYDRDSAGPEVQQEGMWRHACEHGYHVEPQHVYLERHTGVELFERQELAALLKAMRAREIDLVLLWSTDRFSREPDHLSFLLVMAKHEGVRLEFITEPLDDTDEGWLLRQVMGFASKREWRQIRERTHAGNRKRVEKGKIRIGGIPLYGYTPAPARDRYLENPATAPVVRRIFEAVANGMPLRAVAGMLNDESIPTPTGKGKINDGQGQWVHVRIREIVRNPAYGGQAEGWRWNRAKVNGKKLNQMRPESERIPLPEGVVPALVSWELYEEANARLAVNQRTAARNNRNPEASLLRGGFVRCGRCGRTMHVQWRHQTRNGKRRDWPTYQCRHQFHTADACSHTISVQKLDTEVWEFVTERLMDSTFIEREIERLRRTDPQTGRIADLDIAIRDLQKQIDNLAAGLAQLSQPAAIAAVSVQMDTLAKQQAGLEAEKRRVRERYKSWERAYAWLEDFRGVESTVRKRLADPTYFTYEYKRDLLLAFELRVKVWPEGEGPLHAETGRRARWDIDADPASILDWTAPLTAQTPMAGESADPPAQIVLRPR
jgi:site-specific DNA recombinase